MAVRKKLIALVLALGAIVQLNVAVAQQPTPTLWRFLGIPQGLNRARNQIFNRRGNTPGLERRPPLKSIADPANLESEWKSIKTAAKVKQAEDAAPQKIKAIKYLAKMGCGCYDEKLQGAVKEALIEGLQDCTERVRLATIKAIQDVAENEQCDRCKEKSCCSEEILQELIKIAYDLDETGCFVEPSERVREAAVEAMEACCPGEGLPYVEEEYREGEDQPFREGQDGDLQPPAPVVEPEAEAAYPTEVEEPEVPVSVLDESQASTGMSVLKPFAQLLPSPQETIGGELEQPLSEAVAQLENLPAATEAEGTVSHVNRERSVIEIELSEQVTLPLGTQVEIFHRYLTGEARVGEYLVVSCRSGLVTAIPVHPRAARKASRGDRAVLRAQPEAEQDQVAHTPVLSFPKTDLDVPAETQVEVTAPPTAGLPPQRQEDDQVAQEIRPETNLAEQVQPKSELVAQLPTLPQPQQEIKAATPVSRPVSQPAQANDEVKFSTVSSSRRNAKGSQRVARKRSAAKLPNLQFPSSVR